MTDAILGMEWAVFIRAFAAGSLQRPFVVHELDADGEARVWRIYASARSTLVQLLSHKGEPRGWKSLDRALAEMSKALADHGVKMPPVTVYPDEESGTLEFST